MQPSTAAHSQLPPALRQLWWYLTPAASKGLLEPYGFSTASVSLAALIVVPQAGWYQLPSMGTRRQEHLVLSRASFDLYEMTTVPVLLEESICCWPNQAPFPCCKAVVLVALLDLSITGVGGQSWRRVAPKRGRRLRQSSTRTPCRLLVLPGCGNSGQWIPPSHLSILPQQWPVNERGVLPCYAQHSI